MIYKKIVSLLIAFTISPLSACQSLTETVLPSQPVTETVEATSTVQPAIETPEVTATFIPISKKVLAGLIISSPILGTPQEYPDSQPPEMITPNGLGIINSEGELIKFSGSGFLEGISPTGTLIAYQHGFAEDFGERVDNLFVYNSMTGETIEIVDDLENEGGKTIISWLPDEQKFIYFNDYLTVLFEAYGYFGAKQLLIADISTGLTTPLINDGYQFDISPNQTQIAYTTGELLDSKTTNNGVTETFGCFQPRIYNLVSLTSKPFNLSQLKEKPVCSGYPKWSPDGKSLAWMGYFADDSFRPIIFDLQDGTGVIYKALDQRPKGSLLPVKWFFGEPYFGGLFEPNWIDNSIFWTPSYEINIETGEISIPREIKLPYNPRRDDYIESPDGLFNVSVREDGDALILVDATNNNSLASFLLDDIYKGTKPEIFVTGFFLPGRTMIVGWSLFAPQPNIGNK